MRNKHIKDVVIPDTERTVDLLSPEQRKQMFAVNKQWSFAYEALLEHFAVSDPLLKVYQGKLVELARLELNSWHDARGRKYHVSIDFTELSKLMMSGNTPESATIRARFINETLSRVKAELIKALGEVVYSGESEHGR